MSVIEILEEAKKIFEEKDKLYGSAYKRHGNLMITIFPDGITLNTAEDFERFYLFTMIANKMNRYASHLSMKTDGQDTTRDIGIYSFMLKEIEEEKKDDTKT